MRGMGASLSQAGDVVPGHLGQACLVTELVQVAEGCLPGSQRGASRQTQRTAGGRGGEKGLL